MKVLVIGGGGREHAICWKVSQSPRFSRLYCVPGNAGIAQCAELVTADLSDLAGLAQLATDLEIDLTIVGPEQPLAAGLVDQFRLNGLSVVGPLMAAARLEGSKIFAKQFMERHRDRKAGE